MHTLREFFSGLLREAASSERLTIGAGSFDYLVTLLSRQADASNLGESLPVLTWCYRDAVNSQGHVRFNAFKRLGDTALFLSGFFARYVDSTGGMSYYIDMGSLSYDQAAAVVGGHPVLQELSENFPPLVGVLNTAALKTTLGQEQSLKQLYELYERDMTSVARHRLITRGVAPVRGYGRG